MTVVELVATLAMLAIVVALLLPWFTHALEAPRPTMSVVIPARGANNLAQGAHVYQPFEIKRGPIRR